MILQMSAWFCVINQVIGSNIDVLTANFFDNLHLDPNLSGGELNSASQSYIDRQIGNYVDLIRGKSVKLGKNKRSIGEKLTKDASGTFLLDGLHFWGYVPTQSAQDVNLFDHGGEIHAAALENGDSLVIFGHVNNSFELITKWPVSKGVKIATITLDRTSTLIVVAENDTFKENFDDKSGIFMFTNKTLEKIQSLDMKYAADVALWRIHEDIYMSVGHEDANPIYKWKGKHFDLVQTLKTTNAFKIEPFSIGHSQFLLIANSKGEKKTKTYSDLYKFNYHKELYEIYQKLSTKSCVDVEFFTYKAGKRQDSFIIVANSDVSIVYKYVDDHFIPFQSFKLNGVVDQWLALQSNRTSDVTLVASTRYDDKGLTFYQYDGWSFVEIFPKSIGKVPKSLRSFKVGNTDLLVHVDKEGRCELFNLVYTHENRLKSIHDDVMAWCLTTAEKIRILESDDTLTSRSDIPIEDEDFDLKVDGLLSEINELNGKMLTIEENLKEPLIFSTELTANELVFENELSIHNLRVTNLLNQVIIDELLSQSVDITKNFTTEKTLEIDSVRLDRHQIPQRINGRNSFDLFHLNDNLTVTNLTIINGTIEIPKITQPIIADGDLNRVQVDRIFTDNLNGLDLIGSNDEIEIDHLTDLKVSQLTIGGYINDVDIPTLDKYTLKLIGDQEITSEYTFTNLMSEIVSASDVSDKSLSNLIRIDHGDYDLDQAMIFSENLTITKLKITKSLNDLQVNNSTQRFDVVYTDLDDVQIVTAHKTIDFVEILNPISLHGNIDSLELDKINPVINVSDDFVLNGDYTIQGSVRFEDFGKADDVETKSRDFSVTNLRNFGVKLDSTNIKPKLSFLHQLHVNNASASRLNTHPVDDFVVTNGNNTVTVAGLKIFKNDVTINGSTNISRINHVSSNDLSENVLLLDGDQVIFGRHTVKNLIIDRIDSKATTFGTNLWNHTVTTSTNQDIRGTVVIKGDLITKTVQCQNLSVTTIDDYLFDLIVADTVRKSNASMIGGRKIVNNLEIEHISTNLRLLDLENQLKLNGPLVIYEPVVIGNITFGVSCNSIKNDEFGDNNVTKDGVYLIRGSHHFETVTSLSNVKVNRINSVAIDKLLEDTVKIDEVFEFDSADFVDADVISEGPIDLGGHIERVDFDNTVLSFTDLEQVTIDEKIFVNLTINGSVSFDRTLDGVNVTDICHLNANRDQNVNEFIVLGDVFFAKGPDVAYINDRKVDEIIHGGWFKNVDTTLTAYSEFEEMLFEHDVVVAGYIDNVSLTVLSQNYLSKSRDQKVAAILTVDDIVMFENNVTVGEINQNGDVNGINIEDFIGTALLDDYNQTFESLVFTENCNIKTLEGVFLVDDLDLEEEVMRHDKTNLVTGSKSFNDVTIEHLRSDKNIQIQNCDVLYMLQNAILRGSTYSDIAGWKSIENGVFMTGFELQGSLSNVIPIFDENNVMLLDSRQNVTGRKEFSTDSLDALAIKALKLKKSLNGIYITDLVNYQAFKDRDTVFLTAINFNRQLKMKNLRINDEFNGVNVTELIRNVTNLGALNNLLGNYRDLLEVTRDLERSLRNQAHYLNHYKIVQKISDISNSIKISENRIGNSRKIDANTTRIDFFGWHTVLEEFHQDEYFLYPSGCVSYVNHVLGHYLYLEHCDDNFGRFLVLGENHVTTKIVTNKTRFTTNFKLSSHITKNVLCTLFTYHGDDYPRIFCDYNNYIELLQTLEITGVSKATSLEFEGSLTLFLIVETGVPHIAVYTCNNSTNLFEKKQKIYENQPESVSAVSYNHHTHLIAIASGFMENSMYSGRVSIWKYNPTSIEYSLFQSVPLNSPLQLKFVILPSGELVLYVVCDNPASPLIVFKYQGVDGFKSDIAGTSLSRISYFHDLFNGNMLINQNFDEIHVIRAVFKGETIEDDEI